jgi:hypothetical protein
MAEKPPKEHVGGGRGGLRGDEKRKRLLMAMPAPKYAGDAATRIAYAAAELAKRGLPIEDKVPGKMMERKANALESVVRSLDRCQSAGMKLPDKIVIGVEANPGLAGHADWQRSSGVYGSAESVTTTLNLNCPVWTDPQEFLGKTTRQFTTTDDDHVVIHELVHADFYQRGTMAFAQQIDSPYSRVPGLKESFTTATDHLIDRDPGVSGYAVTQPHEFVAEIGTGLLLGKTYTPETMAIYEHYHAPVYNPLAGEYKPPATREPALSLF